MTRVMLHRPLKSANHIISTVRKNHQTSVSYQNDSPDHKDREKKINPQYLEKWMEFGYSTKRSLVHDMLIVCRK